MSSPLTRILFVDDAATTRRTFLRTMSRRGFDVTLAESGWDAIHKAESYYFPVVVTDLRMPGMDGMTLIQKLQTLRPATSFIVATAVPELDLHRDYGTNRSVVAIVPKPWVADKLAKDIKHAAELHALRLTRDSMPPPREEGRSRILLVQNNRPDADLVIEYVEGSVPRLYDVCHLTRLDDAVAELRSAEYALAISDLSLPDAVGLDAVERLHGTAPDTPLIVLTGLDDEDIALQSMQIGAQDYLTKEDIDQRTLIRSIRYAVERKRAEAKLSQLAYFDQLTGVCNRITFHDKLNRLCKRGQRVHNRFALLFLDLDHFKSANDTLGHFVGDQLLKEAALRIQSAVRDYDTVARIGGDEFAIIVEEPFDASSVAAISSRIIEDLSTPFELSGQSVVTSVSIGVAIWPEAGDSPETILRAADEAMYSAKESGRHEAHFYSDENRQRALSNLLLEERLRSAVKSNEFSLHYQPQVDMQTNKVVGLEALLRWQPGGAVPVSPARFVPILEATGLIIDAGEWIVREACRQLRDWTDAGVKGIRVAINVSARQFEQGDLVALVNEILDEYGLAHDQLEIEITESLLMRDTEASKRSLARLKNLGVRISIDDFGTGYSSLSYLQKFAVDAIKIDRSFVATVGTNDSGHILADAIVGIGQNLGLDVIAEGIETKAQADHFLDRGCRLAQGFYFARPCAAWDASGLTGLANTIRAHSYFPATL